MLWAHRFPALFFVCTGPSSQPPAPHTSLMGTHHTYYIHLLSCRMECPQLCLTSWETPLSSALPCPCFSQVVFPHHWPHGHLHIHRSHSGLCWPLLRVGEFPVLRPLEGSEAPMEGWPILPAGSLPMSLVSRECSCPAVLALALCSPPVF